MRESIGYTFTLNIILVFIFIAFAMIMAIMSYSKAFKINSRIMNEIEKCEGFNGCTVEELNRILSNYGYPSASKDFSCPSRDEITAIKNIPTTVTGETLNSYEMCVYYDDKSKIFNRKTGESGEYSKYRYGVLTYYHVDLPIVGWFKLPVYTRTNWMLDFEKSLN